MRTFALSISTLKTMGTTSDRKSYTVVVTVCRYIPSKVMITSMIINLSVGKDMHVIYY